MPGLFKFSRPSKARSVPPQPPSAQAASVTRADLEQYYSPFASADELVNRHATRVPGPSSMPFSSTDEAVNRPRLPGPSPFRLSPNRRVKPSMFAMRCNVHPFLSPSNPPALRYKFTDPPSYITIARSHSPIPPQLLSQPATQPPLPSLTLVFPRLTWQCPVHASSNGSYVTLFDVLDTLYRFLRTNISEREYQSLPPDSQKRVYEAYQHRCSRFRSNRERHAERMKGVKRVDFLMGEIRFQGLGLASGAANVWIVNVS